MEWLWSVYGYPTWVYVAGLTIRAFNRRKSAQLRIANSDQVDGADLKEIVYLDQSRCELKEADGGRGSFSKPPQKLL